MLATGGDSLTILLHVTAADLAGLVLGSTVVGALVTGGVTFLVALFNGRREDARLNLELQDRNSERADAAARRREDRAIAKAELDEARSYAEHEEARTRTTSAALATLTTLRRMRAAYAERTDVGYAEYIRAADEALLIDGDGFGLYLSTEILNLQGLPILERAHGEEPGAGRQAQWQLLRTLVERCAAFVVSSSWDPEWIEQAQSLARDIDNAWYDQ